MHRGWIWAGCRLSSGAQHLCCCLAFGVLMLGVAPAEGFHSPGSPVSGITSGPDGNLWAAVWHGGAGLYRITPSGQISQLGAGGPEGPLTAGSDGNLWAAVESRGIARITPSGQVALFAPPPPMFAYETDGMTTGPDGNVWFTSGAVNGYNEEIRVSRITPNGQVTSFPIPLSLVPGLTHTTQNELAPREIAAGAGVLWMLTERGLVRTTTEGQISFLPIRATQANPTGLAFGSDGNLWAVYDALAPNSLQLRRITSSGEVSAIPVPGVHTSGDQAVGITSGPDGALWLADGSRILRVTTAGAVTEFPTGLPSTQAESITTGPDGNLWFTAGLVIGRITLGGSVTAFPLPGFTQPSPSVAHPVLKCVVPDLTHKTLVQARRVLIRAHCKLGAVARPKRRSRRKLTVMRQKPNANTLLPIWSKVSVTLGR
jgi:virginiamycin B lyase